MQRRGAADQGWTNERGITRPRLTLLLIAFVLAAGGLLGPSPAGAGSSAEARTFDPVRTTPKRLVFKPSGLRPGAVRVARVGIVVRGMRITRRVRVMRVRTALRRGATLSIRRANLLRRGKRSPVVAGARARPAGWLRVRTRPRPIVRDSASKPRAIARDSASNPNVASIWGELAAAGRSRHTWHANGGPNGSPYRQYVVRDGDRYQIFYPDGSTYRPSDAAERTEVGRNDSRGGGSRTFALYREGQRRVTRFWIRLPDRSLVGSNRWTIFLQQKQTQPHRDAGGSPVISLQASAGRFRLRMTDSPRGSANSEVWSTPARTGTWLRGVIRATYSHKPARGRIRVRIGNAVSPVFTRHTLKRSSSGNPIPSHLRVGIYRDRAISNTSRIQFGRVRVHRPR